MPVITAFCTLCQREATLSDDDARECPVCSSPLIETAPVTERVRES